jgi:hypothetical protein
MSAYRSGWRTTAAALTLVGILAAAALSPADLMVLFAAFAAVGAVTVLLIRDADGARPGRSMVRAVLVGAGVSGSSAGAFVGWAEIIGAAALVLVLAVAVASPRVVGAISRGRGRDPTTPESEGHWDTVARVVRLSEPGRASSSHSSRLTL